MAKLHADLQAAVKKLFELKGWYITENKKGKSSRYYNSGRKGIADLQAVKPLKNILWLEIKSKNDVQKPDQKIFQEDVESKGHKYYLIYDMDQAYKILELNK
jgi:hypothetical protein